MNAITEKHIIDHMESYLQSKNIEISTEGNEDVHLFSSKIGLRARDLVYLLNNLQSKYSVVFNEKDILSEDFFTFKNIAILTKEKISAGKES